MGIEEIKANIIYSQEKKKAEVHKEATIISGELHKLLNLHNAMPIVCSAMYLLMNDKDEILAKMKSKMSP
ncbi:MAG: hypothetical protein RR272_04790 [Synergistaceae bacterium]